MGLGDRHVALVHNQGSVRDDYIVIKMELKWLLCYTVYPNRCIWFAVLYGGGRHPLLQQALA